MDHSIRIDDLERARRAISPHIHRTPLLHSTTLSEMTGLDVYVKAELFQKTGSYKPRGMLWALMQMDPERRARGVTTFSSGNAAQGLAYAAAVVGAKATVVMPKTVSPVKLQATRAYGAAVVLKPTAAECLQYCLDLERDEGVPYQPSYNHDDLMTGHSSLGLEILEDLPDVDAIFVGIGGGGMAGGTAKAKAACESHVMLMGVEPEGAPAMRRSLDAGHAVKLERVNTVADGLSPPNAGELCYALVRDWFSDVVLVPDEEIIAAMKLLMSRCKVFAEPAGSAALAGLLASKERFEPGSKVVCVVSGGNLDLDRLKDLL